MRRLFTVAAALSLLIAVFAAASWAASRDNYLGGAFHIRGRFAFMEGHRGEVLQIGIVQGTRASDPTGCWLRWFTAPMPVQIYGPTTPWKVVPGFLWSDWTAQVFVGAGSAPAIDMPPLRSLHGAIIPWWAVVLAPAILPALWLLMFIARRSRTAREGSRQTRGLCRACGYDLRASADRCPECGAAITEAGAKP